MVPATPGLARERCYLAVVPLICGCLTGNEKLELFADPRPAEINAIVEAWELQPHRSGTAELVRSFELHLPETRTASVVAAHFSNRSVYGLLLNRSDNLDNPGLCLFLPDRSNTLLASGQTQTIEAEAALTEFLQLSQQFDHCAILLVATRGSALVVHGQRYFSEGSVCAMQTTAVEDTMALLDAVDSLELGARSTLSFGLGHAGNVALLLGQRDARVKASLAVGAPTNYQLEAVHEQMGKAFECGFLDGLNTSASRWQLIESSPVNFTDHSPATQLIHSRGDREVPHSHSEDLTLALRQARVVSALHTLETLPDSAGQNASRDPEAREVIDQFVQTFLAMADAEPSNADPTGPSTSDVTSDTGASDQSDMAETTGDDSR